MTRTTAPPRPPRHGSHVRASGATELWIMDEIGAWGVTAQAFVADLRTAGSGPVSLHISSPGGEVWDGLAIFEALRSHPGHVTVYVDSLAASAASMIAMAGDVVVMAPNAMLMLHDALTCTVGNERDHLDTAALLSKVSDQLAAIYSARAGGTAAEWREVMRGERWFTASEAVAAGLADRVAVPPALVDAKARGDRVSARSVPSGAGALVACVREGFRSAAGSAAGVPLARAGAPARRPAGRRQVPSAMATLRLLPRPRR